MCGIIGYIGSRQATPIIIGGLKTLEYRGYDSAGIAVLADGRTKVLKTTGKVGNLEKKLQEIENFTSTLGIGHSRWATHGGVTDVNAHPHWGKTKRVTLVHNGIIENYAQIKRFLAERGHEFRSETDTEVLAHLIDHFYTDNLEQAVARALKKAQGAYAVVVISQDDPNKIVLARLSSPLLIGVGENEMIVASDATALLKHTKDIVYLDDGEMAVVAHDSYDVYKIAEFTGDSADSSVKKEVHTIDWDVEEAQKGGYEHFMLKEMMEEGQAVANTLRGRLDVEHNRVVLGGLEAVKGQLKDMKRLVITACGTASYAGLFGSYIIEEITGIPAELHIASELRTREAVFEPGTVVLALSQSGETIDTLEAVRRAKRANILTLGIVNVVGSTIARETDAGVYNHVGPEIAVASSKAYISQLTILIMMALHIAGLKNKSLDYGDIIRHIEQLPRQIERILADREKIQKIARNYSTFRNMFFIGRKYNVSTAFEGSIKLKEISYIHSEAYPAGEMKHGPIALLDKTFPTIVVAPDDSVYAKVVSSIQEARARDSRILAVATRGNTQLKDIANDVIYIPKTLDMLYPVLAVVPLHLFAYYVALELGHDIDKPRNLAKSVTVE